MIRQFSGDEGEAEKLAVFCVGKHKTLGKQMMSIFGERIYEELMVVSSRPNAERKSKSRSWHFASNHKSWYEIFKSEIHLRC